jgi:hypothetical protein
MNTSVFAAPIKGTLSMVRDRLSIPYGLKSFEISTTHFITIGDLTIHLKSQGIPSVRFISLEGQLIPGSTHIQTIKHQPLYISLDESIYKIIPSGTVCHYSTIDLYDSLNLSARDRNLVQASVRHLNNLFTHSDLIPKDQLIQTIHSLVKTGNNEYSENKKKMINLECERAEMLDEYKSIKKKAETYSWRMLWIGFWISVLQFSYIGIGTYMVHSWDFMEPQAYAINLGNFILAYGTYALQKQELSRDNFFDLLTKRRMQQICKVQGFDLQRFDEITKELKVLKEKY